MDDENLCITRGVEIDYPVPGGEMCHDCMVEQDDEDWKPRGSEEGEDDW